MIAIKEMDMPENCLKCPFIDESGQYCRWQYGDIEPDCENCDPMDI